MFIKLKKKLEKLRETYAQMSGNFCGKSGRNFELNLNMFLNECLGKNRR